MEEIKMKDSGIKWISQIPEDWDIKRLKYCVDKFGGGGTPESSNDEFYDDEHGVNWVAIGDMSTKEYVEETDRKVKELGIKDKQLTIYPKGTIIYSIYATIGKVSELKVPATINQALLAIIENKKILNKNYLKKYLNFLENIVLADTSTNTQANLNLQKVQNFTICLPSLIEQQKIAAFLDKKCANIDEIISKTETQIQTLEQYKKSLITETVTKGLNPNVKMKDSGYDWIGQIPEKWSIKKMKYCCDVIGSGTTPDSSNIEFYENGTIPWIQSGDLYQKDTITETEKKITTLAVQSSLSLKLYKKDFLVIAMYGASVGNAAISKIDAYVNQACCAINSIRNNIKFIYYWIKSANNYLIDMAFGGTQPNISQIIIKNTPIVIPSREEQDKIVEFLDQKCDKVNKVLNKQKESLETLKKYKQSLIYEYVTGKKRV